MTLLESVIAFLLLAVVGVACLDLARGATGLETSSAAWSRAIATGESAMAAAAAGIPLDEIARDGVQVMRQSRAGDAGVEEIEIVVALPGGAEFRASRLVHVQGSTLLGIAR